MIIDNIVKNACDKSCHCFLKFFPNLASVKKYTPVPNSKIATGNFGHHLRKSHTL